MHQAFDRIASKTKEESSVRKIRSQPLCLELALGMAFAVLQIAWPDTPVVHAQEPTTTDHPTANDDGFNELYNGKDLSGWTTNGNWLPQSDGSLLIQPRKNELGWGRFDSYLWSTREFDDFELRLEVSYSEKGNSGIYFRVEDRQNPVESGIEIQVIDSYQQKMLTDHTLGGIIPAGIAPSKNMANPPGEWNRVFIRCVGSRLAVTVNDQLVADVDLNKTALKDRPAAGFIGLQDHGHGNNIRFRNIQIKEIASPKPGDEVNAIFHNEILPIFETRCLHCHGAEEQLGGIRLDTLVHILRGGDSGEPAVVPGDDTKSHLMELILFDDEDHRMPLDDGALSADEIELIRKWIRTSDGWAPAVESAKVQSVDHWSFQPVEKPSIALPQYQNPIDFFIESQRSKNGLTPSETASDRQLIRRLFLVVHGLPPSPEQMEAFVLDKAADKWSRLVTQVLQSPHYGERMAVPWLDLIRFSETDGFEMNTERLGAWRVRDWIIRAFNEDMPYDQFVTHQLVGDATGEPAGTGFLVAGPHNLVVELDQRGQAENVQNEVADMLNATSTSLLGLTLGCARCHNHKFDPISQTDFYSVQAIFSGVNHGTADLPLSKERQQQLAEKDKEIQQIRKQLKPFQRTQRTREPVNPRRNVEEFAPRPAQFVRLSIAETQQPGVQACIDELEIYANTTNVGLASAGATLNSSGDFVHPLHQLKHINDGRYGNEHSWIPSESKGWVQVKLARIENLNRIVWGRDRSGKFADRLITEYQVEISLDGETWERVTDSNDRKRSGLPNDAYLFDDLPPKEIEVATKRLQQLTTLLGERTRLEKTDRAYIGVFTKPSPTHRLSRGDPMAPREAVTPNTIGVLGDLGLSDQSDGIERRQAFANWVANPTNPLTARVMVNRIWQFHFGIGLVDTPNDFGLNGNPPSHPELLDWLAAEFVENRWSIKHMHQLILNSKTWRQSSRPREDALEIDIDSRLLWRFPPRRLEAEAIRDSILAVSTRLNRQTYGAGFSGFDVEKENVRHYSPKTEYGPQDWRRMVYMTRVRKEVESVFGAFDCPDGNQVTPRRNYSTTPLQALNLLNGEFVMQQAEFLAAQLEASGDDPLSQASLAFRRCYGRSLNEQESQLAVEMIDRLGLIQFCRVLLNTNEFVFIL
jgi:hypothetical protein